MSVHCSTTHQVQTTQPFLDDDVSLQTASILLGKQIQLNSVDILEFWFLKGSSNPHSNKTKTYSDP